MQQLAHQLPRRNRQTRKGVRSWVAQHRRALRFAVMGIAVFAALLEVVQIAYPSDRLLPFVAIGGQRVGGNSITGAAAQLDQRYANATVAVKTDTKTFTGSLDEMGVSIDAEHSAQDAARYPLWQRMIPFSSVIVALVRDTPMQTDFDDQRVRMFAEKVQQQGHTNAVNASLTVKEGKAALVPSVPDKSYPTEAVVAAIKDAYFAPQTKITVSPQTKPAALTDKEAEAMLDEVQQLVDDKLSLTLQDDETGVDKKIVGGWLAFTANAAASRLDVTLKADPVKKYLGEMQTEIYRAPGTTRVQLIDDREVSRKTGTPGYGVDMDKALAAIENAIKTRGEDTVGLSVGDLPPVLAYDKKYSNTDKDLAGLLSGIANAKGDYGISLMELDGRSAYAHGNRQFVAASTYKLYVAYAVFKEVEAGRLSWSDTVNGKTAAKCFDDMIVVSDNECPKAFGRLIGWSAITTMMHDLGLSGDTRLGSAMYTTPNDLAYFLYRIQNGSIVSSADRERLLDAMKRQSYTRAGIPAGAGGTVADKVGEVDGYYHDAAIVYGSKKTYVLVVMSYGGSFPGIASVAGQVHAAVNK
jgi:beta-lactamase class A